VLFNFGEPTDKKIHDIVVKKSNWNNNLSRFSWRIDTKSRVRNSNAELNESVAIIEWEINTNPSASQPKPDDSKVVRFEMDKDQILSTLHQINSIQNIITAASQK